MFPTVPWETDSRQRVATTWSWLARVRNSGRSETARSSSSRAALAPGSRSSSEEGTRSVKTRMPWLLRMSKPGSLEQAGELLDGEPVLAGPGLAGPVLRLGIEEGPGLGEVTGHRPGEHGGVPLADQQREGAVGPQHRDDRVQRGSRIIDEAEHAVAQDQVDTLVGCQLAQVAQVALQTGDPVGHSLFVGPAGEGSQGVGAGVDDGDPVALGRHPDREPAGAAADVEDLLLPTALEQGADGVPDHRGAGGSTTFEGAVHGRNPSGVR